MAHTEMTTKAKAERVLLGVEKYLYTDWLHGGGVVRPTPHTVSVRLIEQSSVWLGFPTTAFGWIANLGLTVITLGLWILPWLVWIAFRQTTYQDTIRTVLVSVYEEDEGGTHVIIESTDDEWHKDIEEWLQATFDTREERER
jgi:hypothetical protein